jgi:hypothetical protein
MPTCPNLHLPAYADAASGDEALFSSISQSIPSSSSQTIRALLVEALCNLSPTTMQPPAVASKQEVCVPQPDETTRSAALVVEALCNLRPPAVASKREVVVSQPKQTVCSATLVCRGSERQTSSVGASSQSLAYGGGYKAMRPKPISVPEVVTFERERELPALSPNPMHISNVLQFKGPQQLLEECMNMSCPREALFSQGRMLRISQEVEGMVDQRDEEWKTKVFKPVTERLQRIEEQLRRDAEWKVNVFNPVLERLKAVEEQLRLDAEWE